MYAIRNNYDTYILLTSNTMKASRDTKSNTNRIIK